MIRELRTALASLVALAMIDCAGGASVGPTPAVTTSLASPMPSIAPSPVSSASSSPSPSGSNLTSSSVACGTASTEPAIAYPGNLDADTFYAQPSPFPNVARGTVLGSRSVTYENNGNALPNQAWQIRFVSCDAYAHPIAAVATIVEPLTPMPGVEPLAVEAFAEDALGAQCAPSHAVTGFTGDSNENLEFGIPNALLNAGWTVLYPDYEGPQSEFGVGRLEGQITLDSVRAAEQFTSAGLNAQTPVALNGYSGGAIAIGWATSLQASYAPKLNIVGVTIGGVPADLIGIMNGIDSSSQGAVINFFNVVFMLTMGINRAYPTFMSPILNANGVATALSIENGCVGATSSGGSGPTGPFPAYLTVSNYGTSPGVIAAAAVSDLAQPSLTPTANVLVYQSQMDEVIPIAGVDKMVSEWCAAGAKIGYYRAVAGEHIATEGDNEQSVVAYLTSAYEGVPLVLPPTSTTCN